MCGRYYFSRDVADDMMVSILNTMDRKYPGRFKAGEARHKSAAIRKIAA